jgi:hypothetical protein
VKAICALGDSTRGEKRPRVVKLDESDVKPSPWHRLNLIRAAHGAANS